jgi:hypothetical protein
MLDGAKVEQQSVTTPAAIMPEVANSLSESDSNSVVEAAAKASAREIQSPLLAFAL